METVDIQIQQGVRCIPALSMAHGAINLAPERVAIDQPGDAVAVVLEAETLLRVCQRAVHALVEHRHAINRVRLFEPVTELARELNARHVRDFLTQFVDKRVAFAVIADPDKAHSAAETLLVAVAHHCADGHLLHALDPAIQPRQLLQPAA